MPRPAKRRRIDPEAGLTLLESILNCLEDGFVVFQDDEIMHCNHVASRIPLAGKSRISEIPWINSREMEKFWRAAEEAARLGRSALETFVLSTEDGDQGKLQLKGRISCCDSKQGIFCWIIKSQEWLHMERQLKFFEIVRQHLDCMWCIEEVNVVDNDVRRLCVSRAFTESLLQEGIPPDTVVNCWIKKDSETNQRVKLDWWCEQFKKVLQHPQRKVTNLTSVLGPRKIQVTSTFLDYTEEGNPLFLQMVEDIDEQANLRDLIKNAPIGMGAIEVDLQGRTLMVVQANPCLRRILGLPRAMNLETDGGYDLRTFGYPQEKLDFFTRCYLEAKNTGKPYSVEFEGHFVPHCWALLQAVGDEKFLFLVQDITAIKAMEDELRRHKSELEKTVQARTYQLEQAVKVKSRFLAVMSHEIRTPLSGMMGAFNLLSETNLDFKQRELLRTGSVCGEQLLTLINDILDLSKMEANKMVLESVPLDIRVTLEESLEVVSCDASKKNLELIPRFDPSLPQVIMSDPCRLRQILINLLNNAVKFSSDGEVTLTASLVEIKGNMCTIQFSVEDHGIGIPEEQKPYIFESFTQAETDITRKFGGTGLGLSISKRLVELMEGRIWFNSTLGVGSTFFFTICTPISQQEPKAPSPELMKACEGKNIIVCMQNQHLSLVIQSMLEEFKIRCQIASVEELSCMNDANLVIVDSSIDASVITGLEHITKVVICGYENINLNLPFLKKPVVRSRLENLLADNFLPPPISPQVADKSPKIPLLSSPILLVEDNAVNRQIIQKIIECLGFGPVEVAENGLIAVEAVRKKRYSLILMDIMMPVMNGIEGFDCIFIHTDLTIATKIIQAEVPLESQPPIVALTANAFNEDKETYIQAGMKGVITKPIKKEDLRQVLVQYCTQ